MIVMYPRKGGRVNVVMVAVFVTCQCSATNSLHGIHLPEFDACNSAVCMPCMTPMKTSRALLSIRHSEVVTGFGCLKSGVFGVLFWGFVEGGRVSF
jgi:hypothetical protein